MEFWIQKLFQDLLFLILKLLDGVCRVFDLLVGLEQVDYTTEYGTAESAGLLDFFLQQDLFTQIFLSLFVVSVLVLIVCMVFAVFRTMFSNKAENETKSHTKIIGDGIRSILTTCLIFIVTVTGIGASNALLKTVNNAITGQDNVSMARVVLELGLTNNATEIDYTTSNVIKEYQLALDKILWQPSDGYPDNNEYNSKDKIIKVLEKNGDIWDKENNSWNWLVTAPAPVDTIEREQKINTIVFDESGYIRSNITSTDIWGTYTTNWVGLPNGGWDSENSAIDGSGYEALMPYLCAFILLYILCTTCFTLVKRSFDIVILLFVLPFVNATVPLDDGAHMKLWRETMISKILLAFGAVFSMAVFNIFAPLTMKIYIANNAVLTGVLRLLLIVGGGLSISGGMALISRLVGTGIAEGNEMASSARTLLAGGAGAIFTASRAIRGGNFGL